LVDFFGLGAGRVSGFLATITLKYSDGIGLLAGVVAVFAFADGLGVVVGPLTGLCVFAFFNSLLSSFSSAPNFDVRAHLTLPRLHSKHEPRGQGPPCLQHS
jgi:hypothetical protein